MKDHARQIAESYLDHKASPFEADLCRKLARELRGVFKGQWHNTRNNPPARKGCYLGARWTDTYNDWVLGIVHYDPDWADMWDGAYEIWTEIPALPKRK